MKLGVRQLEALEALLRSGEWPTPYRIKDRATERVMDTLVTHGLAEKRTHRYYLTYAGIAALAKARGEQGAVNAPQQ